MICNHLLAIEGVFEKFSIIYIITSQNLEYRLIFIIVTIISLCDIFAYLTGKKFGKNKIFPKISPNKTWAGIFFGWITVIAFYYILKAFNLFVSDFFVFVFFGIALSSQVGDFIESYIKRNLGVKDTGNIIPGHGGLLDRFDGLICASFFVKIIDFFLTT